MKKIIKNNNYQQCYYFADVDDASSSFKNWKC